MLLEKHLEYLSLMMESNMNDQESLGEYVLDVQLYPSPILDAISTVLTEDEIKSPHFRQIIRNMKATAKACNAEGIAAPQVGLSARLFVMTDDYCDETVFINPEITDESENTVSGLEGCLSFPGITSRIERPYTVTVKALNESGEEFEFECSGMQARVICHEIDHLNGTLLLRHMSPVERLIAKKQLDRLKKHYSDAKKPKKT